VRPRLVLACLLGALLDGCSAQPVELFVPASPDVQSLIVILESAGTLDVSAADWTQDRLTPISLSRPNPSAHVYVLEYAEPIAHYGLEAGTLASTTRDDPLARALPTPTLGSFEVIPEAGQSPTPLPAGAVPAALSGLIIKRSSPCRSYAPTSRSWSGVLVISILALDANRSLVVGAATPPILEIVTSEGIARAPIAPPVISPTAVASDGAGRVFLGGIDPSSRVPGIWVGDPSKGLSPLAPAYTSTAHPHEIVVAGTGSTSTSLVVLDGAGRVQQLRDGVWSERFRTNGTYTDPFALCAAGADLFLIASSGGSTGVLHIASAGFEFESVPTPDALTELAVHPTLGVLAGDTRGEVFRRTNTTWSKLDTPPLGQSIEKFRMLPDGFVVIDIWANAAEYHEGFGFCPEFSDPAADRVEQLGGFEDGFLLATHSRTGTDTSDRLTALAPL
jgi:hypothetical protein